MLQSCAGCVHCLPFKGETMNDGGPALQAESGYCRRNPPAVVPVMLPQPRSLGNPDGAPMLTMQGIFPPVRMADTLCGEYRSTKVTL